MPTANRSTSARARLATNGGMPEPIRATDRLRLIYGHPGPYTSVYVATRPLLPNATTDLDRRWASLRADLETQCAPLVSLQAIDARLALPAPDDTAAIGIVAAADGTTIVDHGQEPPRVDVAVVDALPYAGPLLEWDQRRLAHLVVTVDESGADLVTFGVDHRTRLDTHDGSRRELTRTVIDTIRATSAELVVVAGPASIARPLAADLIESVPTKCRIVAEPDTATPDELADATVRLLSDTAARTTVGYLRELRFLAAHHAAVDGTADTIAALRSGDADVLLIHDDPDDQRRIWIGPNPHDLSLESRPDHPTHARLVDAAIRAAITTNTIVHVIPRTGPHGPDDNTAALNRTAAHDEP